MARFWKKIDKKVNEKKSTQFSYSFFLQKKIHLFKLKIKVRLPFKMIIVIDKVDD